MSADLAGRPVLVTGGAGFIGSVLVEDLVGRDARVTVLDNLSTGYADNLAAVEDRVEMQTLDLARNDVAGLLAGGGFAAIFHLAAGANLPASVEDPRADFERGAIATFNLLEAVRAAAPETAVIHVSSAAIYGEGRSTPFREEDRADPTAPYAASKLAAEGYMTVYARVYGLRTAIARLFTTYGPRLRKQVVYDLMRKVHENPDELPLFGDGSEVRDFNHVANVVEALLTVYSEARLEGEAYNVAGDEEVPIRQLAEMICERMGASPRFVYSGDVRPGEMRRLCGDIARLKELGYRPRLNLADGLSDTVAWFREEQLASSRRS
jgi:UDP-glucose 4-epimerase